MPKTTQLEWVKDRLTRGSKISPLDALNGCGCFRLAALIHILRRDGWNIKTTINERPGGAPFAMYHLIKKPDDKK